jgi:hypothetical protein
MYRLLIAAVLVVGLGRRWVPGWFGCDGVSLGDCNIREKPGGLEGPPGNAQISLS